jgi:nucleoid-associated protein YgaU
MDTVAAQRTGDAGNHRSIAEANNINNPNKVKNGTPLVVPK